MSAGRTARRGSMLLAAIGFRWRGVPREPYRAHSGTTRLGASRQVLAAGSAGAPIGFDVRYFELAPAARTNFEQHRHAHVVIGLRGSGRVRLGRRWVRIGRRDVCVVAPETPHELHNDCRVPFGFLCIVDARRDRGRPVERSRASGRRPKTRRARK